jgi:hypothetical protein
MSKYLLDNKSNDPIKSFNMLPFINEGEQTCILSRKNIRLGLTKNMIISNVKSFIAEIEKDEIYLDDHFLWRHERKGKSKDIPLVVKYLFFRGIGEIVFLEEIEQILALDAFRKKKDISNPQWWHCYADEGYDIQTFEQFRKWKYKEKTKMYKTMYKAKGLVLLSDRPGPKFITRKSDPNDPLRWGEKKKEFDNKCATCGDAEGLFSSSNGISVRLEKGHIDARGMESHSNTIPQCGSCNNHSDKYIYGPSIGDPKRYIIKEKLSITTKQ